MPAPYGEPNPKSGVDGRATDRPLRPVLKKQGLPYKQWKQQKMFVRPFFYTVEDLETTAPLPGAYRVPRTGATATVGTTRTATIKISQGADFEAIKIMCVGYDASRVPQNHFEIFIKEGGSDRFLMNYPIHMLTMTGTGQMPFILPVSLLVKEAATLTVAFTLTAPVVTYIYFTLAGAKYFYSELQSLTSRPMDNYGDRL